ncbi:MAG: hypothetical protein HIU85_10225 [Proteobacteria bacterium]|nr:hypothetical protein [Pseudomonadota bacterium]
MGSITLPQPTTHGPAHGVPERRAHSHAEPPRERFAPIWLRTSLVLATLVALGLLYPRAYIETRLRGAPPPNAATLAYLRLMVMAQPTQADTRILLATQALNAGDISLTRYALEPWRTRGWAGLPLEIALLKLHLLRAGLDTQRSGSMRQAQLAEAYTRAALLLAPRMKASGLMREARFAAVLGRYRTAAHLYRFLILQTQDAGLRREAFDGGINALRAADRPRDALRFAQDELAFVPPSPGLWRLMTRLALMADAPRLAARYARRLIGFERS